MAPEWIEILTVAGAGIVSAIGYWWMMRKM